METTTIFDTLMEGVENGEGAQAPAANNFEAARAAYLTELEKRAREMAEDNNLDLNEADTRFSTALNLRAVRDSLVAIVGAGGLGNWQWRILAAMGFKRIAIYDDDVVGIENVGPQAHSIFDLGIPKVEAVANAALAYRGIRIIARNKRVSSFVEICEDLGETPDIVIGCTDSAEFRSEFGKDLTAQAATWYYEGADTQRINKNFPELYIDYRMALGDWTVYILPLRAMVSGFNSHNSYTTVKEFFLWYTNNALFAPEEALQQPCTERAIAYTGASVASYTGALLHWLYSEGFSQLRTAPFHSDFCYGKTQSPGRMMSFSSRDFEFITDTKRDMVRDRQVTKIKDAMREKQETLARALYLPDDCDLIGVLNSPTRSDMAGYRGCVAYGIENGNYYVVGQDVLFQLRRDGGYPTFGEVLTYFEPDKWVELGKLLIFQRDKQYMNTGIFALAANPRGTVFTNYAHSRWYKSLKDGILFWCSQVSEATFYQFVDFEWYASLEVAEEVPEEATAAFAAYAAKEGNSQPQALTLDEITTGMIVRFTGDDSGTTYRVICIDNRLTLEDCEIGDEVYLSLRSVSQLEKVEQQCAA